MNTNLCEVTNEELKFGLGLEDRNAEVFANEVHSVARAIDQTPNDALAWHRLGFLSAHSYEAVTEAIRLHAVTANVGKFSYMAGLLDSDARSIGFIEGEQGPEPRIGVNHNDPRLIRWLLATFGGEVA
jgi:hypothetical protein